jgi:hypothetical protein
MTKSKKKKPRRPGLPAKKSVVEEKVYVSPKGGTYRILRTNEVDEYEEESLKVSKSQSLKGRGKNPL